MFWLTLAALAADVPAAFYTLGQDEDYWSLGDETFQQGATWSTAWDRSADREALGIAGTAAAPRVPRELAGQLVTQQICRVRVAADVIEVGGCPEPLAEATRAAVSKWKWRGDEPREFDLVYGLKDGWALEEGCFSPFTLFGSGTPVLDNSGAAGCPTPVPKGDIHVPVMPSGVWVVECLARLTATVDGVQDVTVTGCDEPYASRIAGTVPAWRFKAVKGEPTAYVVRVTLIAWPPAAP